MRFLGIDLAWKGGASGYCCLQWQAQHLEIVCVDRSRDTDELLAWIDRDAPFSQAAMVAVDAPLIIPNLRGMRTCDRQSHQLLGRYHAGCYPANQQSPFAQHTTGFSQALRQRGFHHAPTITPQERGRFQIEVFPHATAIALFQLDQIIQYKKGRLAERIRELARLRDLMTAHLRHCEPPLMLQIEAGMPTTGRDLKALEDQLDAILCAYTAAYWWYWGRDRHWVLGSESFSPEPAATDAYIKTGYIVVPRP
ncbi:DUF429 domain-containing protein [Thermosynechococcus sp. HN-54]|uniref:DUF429 domain-containing protein n=1 Tax=Thermosynechococcus sp. HN-54 TaxID=2933959 RepID=UPI00202CAEEB|nr:DUF429 domain-containing protein [Thermosynechococcus sp. HN-54]URR34589.1 DUF429 domain-containing protein [Thermosynechococcus sp. HN-54]